MSALVDGDPDTCVILTQTLSDKVEFVVDLKEEMEVAEVELEPLNEGDPQPTGADGPAWNM